MWWTILTSYLPQVIALASAVATAVPSGKPDSALGIVKTVLNVLALNVGHAAPSPHGQKKDSVK